jgi:hypothetical protein
LQKIENGVTLLLRGILLGYGGLAQPATINWETESLSHNATPVMRGIKNPRYISFFLTRYVRSLQAGLPLRSIKHFAFAWIHISLFPGICLVVPACSPPVQGIVREGNLTVCRRWAGNTAGEPEMVFLKGIPFLCMHFFRPGENTGRLLLVSVYRAPCRAGSRGGGALMPARG